MTAVATIVQRFLECRNMLNSFVANLTAIGSFATQRTVVEEASRRAGVCIDIGSLPRCCTDPLGVLCAFPASALEYVVAQHNQDVGTLLLAISQTQQAWRSKVQQAKGVLLPPPQLAMGKGTSGTGGAENPHATSRTRIQKNTKSVEGASDVPHSPGAYALLAVLSAMDGWLRDVVLALRNDLANPPRAVRLSQLLLHTPHSLEVCAPQLCRWRKHSHNFQTEYGGNGNGANHST
ncbi:hypothetical protein ERJ75_001438000 [Trypanosoma vivax]|nr:hypothetical protein ERJ75_001438000 [Trypanosoma vivax]